VVPGMMTRMLLVGYAGAAPAGGTIGFCATA